jgi:aerobic C4-dicarboxylate transport protein
MKVWVKTILAGVAGVLVGTLIAARDGMSELAVAGSQLALQVGRYALFPVVFFGLVMGTHELRRAGLALKSYGHALLYLISGSALLTIIGLVSVLALSPDRVPIVIVEATALPSPNLLDTLAGALPANLFQVLGGSGATLLPLLVLAIILGANLDFDEVTTRPIVQIVDSLSRVFFHINTLVVEVFWLALVVVAAATFVSLSKAELALYQQLLIILVVDVIVLWGGVLPGVLYFLGERQAPFKWLYGALGPALTAAVTGDQYVATSSLILHGRASYGLPRSVGSMVYPLFAIFGRAGTALVTAVSFVLVMRSYSSIELGLSQIAWVGTFSFLISFALGGVPGMGALVSLAMLSSLYGRGLQEGYLILQPIAPLLVGVAAFLDTSVAAVASVLVGRQLEVATDVEMRDFV